MTENNQNFEDKEKSVLNQKRFKLQPSKTVLFIAFFCSVWIGILIDNKLIQYPLKFEHNLIAGLVVFDDTLQSKDSSVKFLKSTQLYVCALERTEKEFSYIQYKLDSDEFTRRLDKNEKICAKDISEKNDKKVE